MQNAGAFLNDGGNTDIYREKPQVPDDTLELPTTTTARPVKIFKVTKKGKNYQILGDGNVTWNMPSYHYDHLLQQGKAPRPGDQVMITFNADNSVKSFSFSSSR